jgi:hypothetical protein
LPGIKKNQSAKVYPKKRQLWRLESREAGLTAPGTSRFGNRDSWMERSVCGRAAETAGVARHPGASLTAAHLAD